MTNIYESAEAFRRTAYERADESLLAPHLGETHGLDVVGTHRLDGGVYRVDLREGPPVVARVFPRLRSLEATEGDAEILRFLETHEFPAERCVPDPVSTLDGSSVLVTKFVPGRNSRGDRDPGMLRRLGELLAMLHALPLESGAVSRPAGSWHSLSIDGGDRRQDIDALLSLLADVRTRASSTDIDALDQICNELDSLDMGTGLPVALTHPDFVGANVIRTDAGEPVLVDWTSAGTAPRICSLGWLLASTGGDSRLIDAVMSGYQTKIELTDEEVARMPDSVRAFALVLDCWGIVYMGAPPAAVAAKLEASRRYGALITEGALRAIDR